MACWVPLCTSYTDISSPPLQKEWHRAESYDTTERQSDWEACTALLRPLGKCHGKPLSPPLGHWTFNWIVRLLIPMARIKCGVKKLLFVFMIIFSSFCFSIFFQRWHSWDFCILTKHGFSLTVSWLKVTDNQCRSPLQFTQLSVLH